MTRKSDRDRNRREVENIIGYIVATREELRITQRRMLNKARTKFEKDNIEAIITARKKLAECIARLAQFHPNRRY